MLTLNFERRRRALGFEAGDHRRSLEKARSGRQKTHHRKIFLPATAIGDIAAALDYVYNRRATDHNLSARRDSPINPSS
jgi:hypothetical protein